MFPSYPSLFSTWTGLLFGGAANLEQAVDGSTAFYRGTIYITLDTRPFVSLLRPDLSDPERRQIEFYLGKLLSSMCLQASVSSNYVIMLLTYI